MTVKQNLEAIKAVIADPANWTQCAFATNKDGDLVAISEGTCFCILGAAAKVMEVPDEEAYIRGLVNRLAASKALRKAAWTLHNRSPESVNDNLGHQAVMDLLEYAIGVEAVKEQA